MTQLSQCKCGSLFLKDTNEKCHECRKKDVLESWGLPRDFLTKNWAG